MILPSGNTKIKIAETDIGYKIKKKINRIVSNINICAESGEIIALIGINGSGKSTLLKTIAGILKPIKGSLHIDYKLFDLYSKKEAAKKIAVVNSEIIQTQYLKVKNLISFGRFPHQSFTDKISKKDTEIIEKSMRAVNISHLADKNINEISDGERQKVMIARALAQDTEIILLDEPTAFLDLENKYTVHHLLHEIAEKENKCIIFSTHDLNIALKTADKIWLIKDKSIHQGAPEDLILNNHFSGIFKNTEIKFNPINNEFSISSEKKIPVKIVNRTNNEVFKHILINALNRKQFYESTDNTEITIEIKKENEWLILSKQTKYFANTIYDLLKILDYLF
jgi:iron complex transport system ATP-binding protein